MITDDRLRQLMADVGLPNSRSLMQALQQCDKEAALAERARCKRIIQLNQVRNGNHHRDGETWGHYRRSMLDEIDSGNPPKA